MRDGATAQPIRIVVDHREAASGVAEWLQQVPGVELAWRHLATGDYVVDGRLVVERKTLPDFAQSIIDGRLFKQAHRLAGALQRPCLLLEGGAGQLQGHAVSRPALLGALTSVALIYGIPILRSVSPQESASLLVMAARQINQVEAGVLRRPGYRPRTRRGRQNFLLQGLPGTGPVLAERLLERFGSVEAVMQATAEELCAVEGIGTGRAMAIRNAVEEAAAAYGLAEPPPPWHTGS